MGIRRPGVRVGHVQRQVTVTALPNPRHEHRRPLVRVLRERVVVARAEPGLGRDHRSVHEVLHARIVSGHHLDRIEEESRNVAKELLAGSSVVEVRLDPHGDRVVARRARVERMEERVVGPGVEDPVPETVAVEEGVRGPGWAEALLLIQEGQGGSHDDRIRVEDVPQDRRPKLGGVRVPIVVEGVLPVNVVHERVAQTGCRRDVDRGGVVVRIVRDLSHRQAQIRVQDVCRVEDRSCVGLRRVQGASRVRGEDVTRIPEGWGVRVDETAPARQDGRPVRVDDVSRAIEREGHEVPFPERLSGTGLEVGMEERPPVRGSRRRYGRRGEGH